MLLHSNISTWICKDIQADGISEKYKNHTWLKSVKQKCVERGKMYDICNPF